MLACTYGSVDAEICIMGWATPLNRPIFVKSRKVETYPPSDIMGFSVPSIYSHDGQNKTFKLLQKVKERSDVFRNKLNLLYSKENCRNKTTVCQLLLS